MANINKIRLSGQTYNIQDENATKTVELTQAQYDALTVKDPNTFYVITDAQGVDLSNYYTKSETSGATEISTALASKQTTLTAGTNITIVDNVISATGGGGKAVSAGTNISITTGETADTINCTLPFSYEGDNLKTTVSGNSFVNYFNYGQIFGINNTLQGKNSATGTKEKNTTIIGYSNQSLRMDDSIVIGSSNNLGNTFGFNKNNYIFGFSNTVNPVNTQDNIANNNFVIGNNNTINQKSNNFIFGYGIKPSNNDEFSLGKYNNSVSGSSTFGDSGNTLFSVGNGTSASARHNAFEIRQNGDIYITSGSTDIKLQDHLGGGGGGTSYTAGDGIDITNDVISVSGVSHNSLVDGTKMLLRGNFTASSQNYSNIGFEYYYGTSTNKNSINIKPLTINGNSALRTQELSISVVETSAITTSVTSSSTDAQIPSAKAVYDLFGGIKLVKLTQSAYDALYPNYDSNTLYIIVN